MKNNNKNKSRFFSSIIICTKHMRRELITISTLIFVLFCWFGFQTSAVASSEGQIENSETIEATKQKLLVFSDSIKIDAKIGYELLMRIPITMTGDESSIAKNIEIKPNQDQDNWPFSDANINQTVKLPDMTLDSVAIAIFEFDIKRNMSSGEYNVTFDLTYLVEGVDNLEVSEFLITDNIVVNVVVEQPETIDAADDGDDVLHVSGDVSLEPNAESNEIISVRLPYHNGGEDADAIVVRPDFSSDVEQYPFVLKAEGSMFEIEHVESQGEFVAEFNLTLRDNAKAGDYEVIFTTTYRTAGSPQELKTPVTFKILDEEKNADSIVVSNNTNNIKTSAEPIETKKPDTANLKIKEYKFEPQISVAGEGFAVSITVENIGQKNAKDVVLKLSEDTNFGLETASVVFVDADEDYNSANNKQSINIGDLAAGESIEQVIIVKSESEIAPGIYPLDISLGYSDSGVGSDDNNIDNSAENTTETLNININIIDVKKLVVKDVKFDEPIRANEEKNIAISVENKNSFDVDNVWVSADGEGIDYVENGPFTIKNNSTFEFDFYILPREIGDKTLGLGVEFTSINGETIQTKFEQMLNILENDVGEDIKKENADDQNEMQSNKKISPGLAIVLVIIGVVTVCVVVYLVRKKS